jgi:hypothetical protein
MKKRRRNHSVHAEQDMQFVCGSSKAAAADTLEWCLTGNMSRSAHAARQAINR